MRNRVRHCVLCRSDEITTTEDDRVVTSACRHCGAIMRIEFDPPDQPGLRGRIEMIAEPNHRRIEIRH